jgi:hypothetical protein
MGYDKFNSGRMAAKIETIPCFPDTQVLTVEGQIAAKDLSQGDQLILHTGEIALIAGVFEKDINVEDDSDWPIFIKAGAICNGLPRRNFLVLPKQMLSLGGAFIPSDLLINGCTIFRIKKNTIKYKEIDICKIGKKHYFGSLFIEPLSVPIYAEGLPVGPLLNACRFVENDAAVRRVKASILAHVATVLS